MNAKGIAATAAVFLLSSVSSLALAQAGGAASPSTATPAASVVQEVIVTAQRREQSILTVPIAVTAIAGKSLETKGVTNSSDLEEAVPNLQVNSAYGSTQPNFSLRGVSVANEYNSNQVSPIGVYTDDVYIAARTSQGFGLFDLDRIEVLRGPQGTLFGRNTTGGAIDFISATPTLKGSNGYAEIGYGNYETVTVQGAAETTLAGDQVGVRAAVNYAEGEGQFKNVYPGGARPDSTDQVEGRLSLRVRPDGSPLDVTLIAFGGYADPTQAPVFGIPSFRQSDFFAVDAAGIGHNQTSSYGVSAHVTYTLDPHTKLISIAAYGGGNQNLQQAADGSPLEILAINWRSQFHQVSEEDRINYERGPLTLISGVYFEADETATDNLFNIADAIGPNLNGGFFQHFVQNRQSYAVFSQGDYKFAARWDLTLGLRYSWDDAQYRDGQAYLFLGNLGGAQTPLATTVPCAGVAGTCPFTPSAQYDLNGGNSAPTGHVALSYTFDDGVLAYVSYDRGYRSGAFNGGGYTSSSGITFIKPETVNAYQAGLKGRFLDNRLTLALAGFYYDYKNQQLQDTAPGPVSFLVNAPKSTSYGGEVELNFQATPDFVVNGSLGLLNATYDTLSLQGANLACNQLPFAPNVTLQAGFDWRVFDVAGGHVTVSPNVNYYGHEYFSPFDSVNAPGTAQMNSELQQGGYSLVNMSLVWRRGRYALRAWVKNLTDTEALGYGLDLRGAGFPYNFLVPLPPRTFGLDARVSF